MKSKAKDDLKEFSSEESQSEDDEDGWKLTEEVEKEFFKTLSRIKNKDPKIYEKDVKFFKNTPIPENKERKSVKSNPLTLRDYERKIILEKGGEFSDEVPIQNKLQKQNQPTYVEEQELLKSSLKAVLNSGSEEDSEEECGGLFKKREKTEEQKKKDEESYKEWLIGQKINAPDEEVERDMKPLRDYWTTSNLNEDDQYLRDYILNKKFLEHDKKDNGLNVEQLLEESEGIPEEYESNCNHRFEEPDQEFIKRYPRVMEHSLRRKNDHRKQKREEVRERKQKEKEKKKSEIKNKKKQKRKKIEDKIQELKKLTGNDQLAFENVLDQDFDLDEHDKAMKRLFNEEFYSQDDPNFTPIDSTAQEGEWNEGGDEENKEMDEDNEYLNCEDPNFNMDCDYDPVQEKPKEKTSRSRRRKDKHRRTTVSEAVNKEKPTFDPTAHQSFQQYLDEYYAIDCEDFIGDLPCRFKYRRTVPNSFGLTVEEILAADDKELENWCSIKRIQQLRPEFKEKGDVKVFKKKADNETLKRKILPSLFKSSDNQMNENSEKTKSKVSENEISIKENDDTSLNRNEVKGESTSDASLPKANKKKNKLEHVESTKEEYTAPDKHKRKLEMPVHKKKKNMDQNNQNRRWLVKESKNKITNKFVKHNERSRVDSKVPEISDARLLAYGIKPKKFRNKLKYSKGAS